MIVEKNGKYYIEDEWFPLTEQKIKEAKKWLPKKAKELAQMFYEQKPHYPMFVFVRKKHLLSDEEFEKCVYASDDFFYDRKKMVYRTKTEGFEFRLALIRLAEDKVEQLKKRDRDLHLRKVEEEERKRKEELRLQKEKEIREKAEEKERKRRKREARKQKRILLEEAIKKKQQDIQEQSKVEQEKPKTKKQIAKERRRQFEEMKKKAQEQTFKGLHNCFKKDYKTTKTVSAKSSAITTSHSVWTCSGGLPTLGKHR